MIRRIQSITQRRFSISTTAEMEREFKVFVYPDGDPNTYYQTPRKLTGKYASEGLFFKKIKESRFLTNDPGNAHLFFIPISCHKMRGKGANYKEMTSIVKKYMEGLMLCLSDSAD
ncbi:hypothetical protein Dsin_032482 [Dipteronia sinensis]|uniref:Uncharacterized protein n=1 Tax=Dipteronia sinensis TaxID=43782 RepID=A0AAD9ZN21_9ROSI|nr:hypothetical protein Dsin_032482 [Dipteronia sinensis]